MNHHQNIALREPSESGASLLLPKNGDSCARADGSPRAKQFSRRVCDSTDAPLLFQDTKIDSLAY